MTTSSYKYKIYHDKKCGFIETNYSEDNNYLVLLKKTGNK